MDDNNNYVQIPTQIREHLLALAEYCGHSPYCTDAETGYICPLNRVCEELVDRPFSKINTDDLEPEYVEEELKEYGE